MVIHLSWLWAIGGLALLLGELLLPGAYLLWVGAAAVAVGLLHGLIGLTLEQQLLAFLAVSFATCALGWWVYRGQRGRRGVPEADAVNETTSQMIGSIGEVQEGIVAGRGRVRIADTMWLASGPDLAPGTKVRVIGQSGTVLQVEAIGPA